jgi:Protein of unknown function (DUF2867)
MLSIRKRDIPADSALQANLATASFWDAYEAPLRNSALSATEIFLTASCATPPWVSSLMALRNAVVRPWGIKDVGRMEANGSKPAEAYQIGDRIGIFRIISLSFSELIGGIDDSHLDVRVSVKRLTDSSRYVISTTVHIHNAVGRIYMIPVGQIHPLVVRAMMRRAAA